MPGALRTAPRLAKAEGLKIGHPTALSGEASRRIVVVGNYCYGPITVVPCRAKPLPLLHASILVRPRKGRPFADSADASGGGAGYCPRVRYAYSAEGLSP